MSKTGVIRTTHPWMTKEEVTQCEQMIMKQREDAAAIKANNYAPRWQDVGIDTVLIVTGLREELGHKQNVIDEKTETISMLDAWLEEISYYLEHGPNPVEIIETVKRLVKKAMNSSVDKDMPKKERKTVIKFGVLYNGFPACNSCDTRWETNVFDSMYEAISYARRWCGHMLLPDDWNGSICTFDVNGNTIEVIKQLQEV